MIIDVSGRIYGVKATTCVVCAAEITYTHKIKLYCDDCYKIRHTQEVKAWRSNNLDLVRQWKKGEDERRRRTRLERIADLKLTAGCADCGYNTHFSALDFDHVRGTKCFNISAAVGTGISWTRIEQELEKCEVVCANCHRIRTFNRGKLERTA